MTKQIEALAKHVRGLSDLGFGEFRLATLDGTTFGITQNGATVFRGSFDEVAAHVGWTSYVPLLTQPKPMYPRPSGDVITDRKRMNRDAKERGES